MYWSNVDLWLQSSPLHSPPSASHLKSTFHLWDSPVVDRACKLLHGTYGLCSWLLSAESTELSAACWVLTVTQPTVRPSVEPRDVASPTAPLCRKEYKLYKRYSWNKHHNNGRQQPRSLEDGISDSQSRHMVSLNRIHFPYGASQVVLKESAH